MARVWLAPGKKRYSVTLTESKVDRFRSLCSDVGLPPSSMSALCDDAISGMSDVLQTAKDQGTIGLKDIFRLMGSQIELMMEEERKESADYKKRVASVTGQGLA